MLPAKFLQNKKRLSIYDKRKAERLENNALANQLLSSLNRIAFIDA